MKGLVGGQRAVRRVVGVAVVALLAFTAAACGDDGDADDGDSAAPSTTAADGAGTTAPDGSDTTAAPSGDPLGEPNAATGDPVVVGLISAGGDCASCSVGSAQEGPAAEAAVAWVNDYLGGVGGRPIELVTCENGLDPATASDCANQMITEGAVAVVTGADSVVTGWEVLHDAGIPVISFATAESSYVNDPDSTFVFQDPEAITLEFPLGAAEQVGADHVSIIVVDVPAATDIYTDANLERFEDAGIEVDVIPVPLGTLDMTPQAQQIVQDNPDGLVDIVGHDAFCIPAINGLLAAGFEGTISTISFCVTDAMKEAISGEVLDGMLLGASDPLTVPSDPSTVLYNAIMDAYDDDGTVLRDVPTGLSIVASFAGLAVGTAGIEGDVTPDSIIAAMRSMDLLELPLSGGRHFRCNGRATEAHVAVCSISGLTATLDAEGQPVSLDVFSDDPIPD
jgi:branched-chain amino acid transport system substrate-binding protein